MNRFIRFADEDIETTIHIIPSGLSIGIGFFLVAIYSAVFGMLGRLLRMVDCEYWNKLSLSIVPYVLLLVVVIVGVVLWLLFNRAFAVKALGEKKVK